jgi:hypothetical protein
MCQSPKRLQPLGYSRSYAALTANLSEAENVLRRLDLIGAMGSTKLLHSFVC